MEALVGVLGTALLAIVTFMFDRHRESSSRLHQARIDAAVEFTSSIEAYRSAQKRRAHDNLNEALDKGRPIDRKEEDRNLADAVGVARTAAWAAFHRILLVAQEPRGPDLCHKALEQVSGIGREPKSGDLTHGELDTQGEEVRDTMREFCELTASQLGHVPWSGPSPARVRR